jgi:hypothetical protein
MKNSKFRLWVQRIWFENTQEHLDYHELPYTMEQYWNMYKYWLKREYKHRMKTGKL